MDYENAPPLTFTVFESTGTFTGTIEGVGAGPSPSRPAPPKNLYDQTTATVESGTVGDGTGDLAGYEGTIEMTYTLLFGGAIKDGTYTVDLEHVGLTVSEGARGTVLSTAGCRRSVDALVDDLFRGPKPDQQEEDDANDLEDDGLGGGARCGVGAARGLLEATMVRKRTAAAEKAAPTTTEGAGTDHHRGHRHPSRCSCLGLRTTSRLPERVGNRHLRTGDARGPGRTLACESHVPRRLETPRR